MPAYDIIHHDVHPTQLRPHLDRHSKYDALKHARRDKRFERADRFFALEA